MLAQEAEHLVRVRVRLRLRVRDRVRVRVSAGSGAPRPHAASPPRVRSPCPARPGWAGHRYAAGGSLVRVRVRVRVRCQG